MSKRLSEMLAGVLGRFLGAPAVEGDSKSKYANIRTEFVRQRLRMTRWQDREYIQTLIAIEKIVLLEVRTASAARLRAVLREQYPAEYEAIRQELVEGKRITDTGFSEIQRSVAIKKREDEKRQKTIQAEQEAAEKAAEEIEHQRWLDMGGKP